MKRSWFRALLLRRVQVLFLLILQLCFLFFIFQNESFIAQVLRSVVHIISGFLVLYIISKKDKTLYGLPGSVEKSAYYEAPAYIPQIRYLKYADFPVYDDI